MGWSILSTTHLTGMWWSMGKLPNLALSLLVVLHLQLQLRHLLARQALQGQLRRRLVRQLPRQHHLPHRACFCSLDEWQDASHLPKLIISAALTLSPSQCRMQTCT